MKLYTEQTLRNAINQVTDGKLTELSINAYINSLTPIELPTEEEVYNQSPHYDGSEYSTALHIGFREGAKWVIDKIKNQQ